MKIESIRFIGSNGKMMSGKIWIPETFKPLMVLQIAHGMTEHIGRYEKLAEQLTACGIAVAGFDLRGHGENGKDFPCASFGEDGWKASLHDMHLFYLEVKSRFLGIPHYMMGFSLGSFLLRDFLSQYGDKVDGIILMGTGNQPGAVLKVLMMIVRQHIRKYGFDQSTPLVRKLSFENYNSKFTPNRTAFDWLCGDEKELDRYMADPLCRDAISAGLFYQLMDAMRRTGRKNASGNWNFNMPVLLLSGQDDPVGNFGKGVLAVKEQLKNAGMRHVQMCLLKGARHDVLHEEQNGAAEKARDYMTNWLLEMGQQKRKEKHGADSL